jgi:hypothetical protein
MLEKCRTVCIENTLNIIFKNPGMPLQQRQRWCMHIGLIFTNFSVYWQAGERKATAGQGAQHQQMMHQPDKHMMSMMPTDSNYCLTITK